MGANGFRVACQQRSRFITQTHSLVGFICGVGTQADYISEKTGERTAPEACRKGRDSSQMTKEATPESSALGQGQGPRGNARMSRNQRHRHQEHYGAARKESNYVYRNIPQK